MHRTGAWRLIGSSDAGVHRDSRMTENCENGKNLSSSTARSRTGGKKANAARDTGNHSDIRRNRTAAATRKPGAARTDKVLKASKNTLYKSKKTFRGSPSFSSWKDPD